MFAVITGLLVAALQATPDAEGVRLEVADRGEGVAEAAEECVWLLLERDVEHVHHRPEVAARRLAGVAGMRSPMFAAQRSGDLKRRARGCESSVHVPDRSTGSGRLESPEPRARPPRRSGA